MKKSLTYFRTRKWLVVIIVVAAVAIIWGVALSFRKPVYQFVTVKRGTITESVSVTGNTTSTKNISLGFESGGTVAAVYANLGDRVFAGQVLASLNASDLSAQLAQAQAGADAEQAKLGKLLAGARAEDIQVSQAALDTAEQALANAYGNVLNTVTDGYSKANDAVRNQLTPLFSEPESNNPRFIVAINDSQSLNNVVAERLEASIVLNAWQKDLPNVAVAASEAGAEGIPPLDQTLTVAVSRLASIKQLLSTVATALSQASTLSTSVSATYQTAVTTGLNEVNVATSNVAALAQNIATQKSAVRQAMAQLNLTKANATPEDVATQKAQVEQAQANVQSIEAKLHKTSLISPFDGIITMQNAKIGQIAPAGAPVVSVIATNGFEVDANVPEIDVGKLAVGDPVSMTFDAFPNETFQGSVAYINPTETIVQGVVDYLVKITFTKPDPRAKSGLTANCTIATKTESNALVLPQYAILQNDQGAFVKKLENGNVVEVPVTLGIQDGQGNVEVTSGVAEGEQVINIGLK